MRNISDVLELIVKEIPETETELLADLERLQRSILYSAPELMFLRDE